MSEKWVYKGERVNVVSYYKYLGVLFSCRLNWSSATKILAQQGKKSFMSLRRRTRLLGNLSYEHFFKIFDTMIVPILTYGAEIWGYQTYETIERVQYLACRMFLSVHQNSPNCAVLGECGRFKLLVVTAKKCVKYWVKLLKMPRSRYASKCYAMLYHIDSSQTRTSPNWVTHVKDILLSCNMHDAWDAQTVSNVKCFLEVFVTRLKYRLYLDWHGDISTMDKLDSYRNFKIRLEPERYLFSVNIPNHRFMLSRFRCSSHCLRIETDRKNNMDRNERICLLCNFSEIEDEYHFLLVCPFFNVFRKKYISRYYFSPPSYQKFVDLLQSVDGTELQSLAAFLYHSLKLRYEIYKNLV